MIIKRTNLCEDDECGKQALDKVRKVLANVLRLAKQLPAQDNEQNGEDDRQYT